MLLSEAIVYARLQNISIIPPDPIFPFISPIYGPPGHSRGLSFSELDFAISVTSLIRFPIALVLLSAN